MEHKIYFRGTHHGLYGAGSWLLAVKNEDHIKKNQYYRIKSIVPSNLGCCSRNLAIELQGIEGVYTKNTFFVDEVCLNKNKTNS